MSNTYLNDTNIDSEKKYMIGSLNTNQDNDLEIKHMITTSLRNPIFDSDQDKNIGFNKNQGVDTTGIRDAVSSIKAVGNSIMQTYDDITIKISDLFGDYKTAISHKGEIFYTPDKYRIDIAGASDSIDSFHAKANSLHSSLQSSIAKIESLLDAVLASCDFIEEEKKKIEDILSGNEDMNDKDQKEIDSNEETGWNLPDLENMNINWDNPEEVKKLFNIDIEHMEASVYHNPDACQEIIDYFKYIQDHAAENTEILSDDETFQEWRHIGVSLMNTISFWQLRKRDAYQFQAEDRYDELKEEFGTPPPTPSKDEPESYDEAIAYYESILDEIGPMWAEAFDKLGGPHTKEDTEWEAALKRHILGLQDLIQMYKIWKRESENN